MDYPRPTQDCDFTLAFHADLRALPEMGLGTSAHGNSSRNLLRVFRKTCEVKLMKDANVAAICKLIKFKGKGHRSYSLSSRLELLGIEFSVLLSLWFNKLIM